MLVYKILSYLLALVCLFAAGCAASGQRAPDERDPYEGFNRAMFAFNDRLDEAILAPAARGYEAVTPEVVETGVGNFFSNLNDVKIALNNLLQGKFTRAASDTGRVLTNSTLGVLGFFDVASRVGLRKHNEDFGQTLGRWGVPPGPYLVLPFLGPSTFRDAPARGVDYYTYPLTYYPQWELAWALRGLDTLDTRVELFELEERFEKVIFDRYTSLRNVYLERRAYLVRDGEEPEGGDDLLRELEELEDPESGGGQEDDLYRELEEMEAEEGAG